MPEGDTIRRLADRIDRTFGGERVSRSVFRHPRLALVDLSGAALVDASSNGKHLFVRFDTSVSLHVHLLMQGRVVFGRAADVEQWRRRFEITFESGTIVGVDIPLLHVVETRRESFFTRHLGPDVLDDFDIDAALDRMATVPDAPLGGALLDQRLIAGFGNIYAVEVPFICGLSPFTPIGRIDDLGVVVEIGRALIEVNAERGPQNTTGRRLGEGDHWVLGGARLCPICAATIERVSAEASPWRRRTAWCPACQPSSAVAVDVERVRHLISLHPAARRIAWDDLATATDT